jgi:hypothetical protein
MSADAEGDNKDTQEALEDLKAEVHKNNELSRGLEATALEQS